MGTYGFCILRWHLRFLYFEVGTYGFCILRWDLWFLYFEVGPKVFVF